MLLYHDSILLLVSPFHALFNVFNGKKSFIYHFHLAGIVQLLHIFSLFYTIDANDNLN